MGVADSNYKVTDGRQRRRSLLEIAVAFLVVAVEDIGLKVLVVQVQLLVGVYSDQRQVPRDGYVVAAGCFIPVYLFLAFILSKTLI
ncbi:hypothetical protein TB2_045121 [Malus domestica]